MSTPLLSPRAASRRFRRLMGTAAGFALALAAPAAVQAQTVYGLGYASTATVYPVGTQLIGSLNVATGTITSSTPITGVTPGQILVGMDSRPATGELFVLGYDATLSGNNSRLYTLNPTSGVATPVGNAFRLELGGATDRIGFDFNPTVDRIRVVSSYNPTGTNTNNYRLNPTPDGTGAIAIINDGVLAYASGTPADPNIGAAAYTNSAFGASTTVLYDIDETAGLLAQQNPPNNGTLGGGTPPIAPVPITFNGAGFGTPRAIDVDIYTNPSTGAQSAYLIEVTAGGSSNFYNLNLATGAATSVGAANVVPAISGVEVRDIAAAIAPRSVPALTGQLAYAVTTNNNLISFDTQNPSVIRSLVAITGLPTNQTLVGTDFRPNTGQLFGLGYDPTSGANDRLYTIDRTTGVATAVGTTDIDLALGTDLTAIGFDFNPTVDRIRVVSANDANYRLNPNNGAIAFVDGTLAYAAGDPNAGQNPNVGSGAYTNSFVGSAATGLYVLDHVLGTVSFQNPPNNGTLTNSRLLTGVNGAGVGGAIGAVNDLDVYFDGTSDTPYLAAVPNGQVNSRFYSLNALSATNTAAQVATDLGPIGGATSVRDISILLAPNSTPNATAALTGQLLYAVASGNLISFDSGNPGVIRTAVNITGLPADGSQVLAGADFRPLDGSLFALGYNAATQQGQLYSLNITTGALTAVGVLGLQTLSLGTAASAIGFDFNPTVDRIRITSASNQANLRMNPADGSFIVDTNLTNPDNGTAPAISGAAYTNNDNNGNTGTTLYGYDQTANVLTRATVATGAPAGTNAANAGTFRNVGTSSGINVGPGVDFDIYSDISNAASPTNTGFIVAAPTGTTADNLYTIDLTTGAASAGTRIGNGSNLTALAAFLTPGPVIAAGLTWTGAVSTDWGTAGNWNPAQVPTATDNVTIPDVTNDPVVNGNQLANGVTLNTGAILTLADGSVLSVSGNIVNNSATVTSTGANVTGRITLAGAAAQTISGTLTTFPNLTVGAAGASIGGPVSIRRGLVLNGTFTTTSQTLTLLSDATGTAYVVNNGTGTVSGPATVQRYIMPNLNAGPGYRHYSSPVNGNTVADFATSGFTPVVNSAYNSSATPPLVTPFPNIYTYDQARLGLANTSPEFDKGFQSPAATTDAIETGRGYTVNINASALVDFTGTLNNNNYSRTGLTRGAQATAGYHLLGNPYPGAIDYNTVLAASTGMESALYVFKSSGQYTGSYSSYVNGASTNTGTNVLPVAQGFFVRVAAGQTGAVNFTNAARLNAPDNTPFQRTAGTRPELTLTLRNATTANQAVVYFEQGATAGFDAGLDAHYLPATNGLLLATEAGAEALAINGQPALTGTEVAVPLQVAAATAGTYTLAVDNLVNLPANYHAYLRDALTGAYTDLATTPTVTLNLAANGAAGGRYAVVFSTQNRVLATAPAALAKLASVFPNPAHGSATLLLPVALRGQQATSVTVVDNVGRAVLTRTLAAGANETLELPLAGLTPGVYSVLARTASGLVAKRLVVE
ncbi:DUF4394 domain-containing protein [Hymenobacter convexus]|uniref:DUF4394 domain-containing protein n=1 Tax=Hymenobacter sp. CA1UV-4 TaxID=3063782 RepID=UPI002713FC0B|nr:DUF4394 domain-containing protein [Hymenobacter sp. CA1UV-4]MDO7851009.1 DUF4394 domain-containing protein [Hymenobacter sp. CA1UV-4]